VDRRIAVKSLIIVAIGTKSMFVTTVNL